MASQDTDVYLQEASRRRGVGSVPPLGLVGVATFALLCAGYQIGGQRLHNDSQTSNGPWPPGPTAVSARQDTKKKDLKLRAIESKEREILRETARHSINPPDEEPGAADSQAGRTSAWSSFSDKFDSARDSFTSIDWSAVPDTIADYIVPDWARLLPLYVSKLQRELSMAPGSLADQIWDEAHDPDINPEILQQASVRVSNDLCADEQQFLRERKAVTKKALAKYLGLREDEIHSDDIPTIALCGSGGGLRALVAGAGSQLAAQEAGLFDCVTYTAGVSGSCWLQTLYHSSVGGRNLEKLVKHLKSRLGVHIAFPPEALKLLNTAPTNKFLLSGLVEKLQGDPDGDFGLVDVYGLLLSARLLVPKGDLGIDDEDLKLSNQRRSLREGLHPLPIYTAVRHEIPVEEEKNEAGEHNQKPSEATKEKARREAWFQWFEFTPYELWCEELQAGIPTWSIGRTFSNGLNVQKDNIAGYPELRLPLMIGIWGSAFCATLSHYYKEIRPVLKGLTGFGSIDTMIEGRDNDLIKVHPIDPASIPNYVLGMPRSSLPATCPESIFRATHLQLMDAGMSNNLPIYPLLRPGRNVDILIAFDASADIKTENWLSVADGYARQRGIKGWPVGVGWPKPSQDRTTHAEELEAAQAATSQEAAAKVADAREEQRQKHADHTERSSAPDDTTVPPEPENSDLGYCTVWVGSSAERTSTSEPPQSKRVNDDWHKLSHPAAGLTIIYFPFLANPAKVPGVDPVTDEVMSTWNFVYTPEQVEDVVRLARANFEEGREQTRRAVRAVYERKKAVREEGEREWKEGVRRRRMRRGVVGGREKDDGDHGDHFS